MAKHSVEVLIEARNEAAKKFGDVKETAGVIRRAFKDVVVSTGRAAFAAVFQTIKYSENFKKKGVSKCH